MIQHNKIYLLNYTVNDTFQHLQFPLKKKLIAPSLILKLLQSESTARN